MFRQIGFMEIALIVVVALLIFGPSKLPQLGKSVGESIREFKKSMKTVKEEIEAEDKPQPTTDAEKKA
ncbi:MAG: twin-arginine translocase TatA/TatE family subunit [Bacillota bacterium]